METIKKHKKSLAVTAAGIATVGVLSATVTASLWNDSFTFGDGGFSFIKTDVTMNFGGTITNAGPATIAAEAPDSHRTNLINTQQVAIPLTVSANTSETTGVDYSVSMTATGIYADPLTTAKVYEVTSASECVTTLTGTPLYSGVLKDFTKTNAALVTPYEATSGSETLCFVIDSIAVSSVYNQVATVTGTTADGDVTATETWSANVEGVADETGSISANVTWALVRG